MEPGFKSGLTPKSLHCASYEKLEFAKTKLPHRSFKLPILQGYRLKIFTPDLKKKGGGSSDPW